MGRGARELGAVRTSTAAGLLTAALLVAAPLVAGCSDKAENLPSLGATASSSPGSSATGPSSAASSSSGAPGSTASESPSPVAPATTPVAPPSTGSTKTSVPGKKVTKRKAVSLKGRAEAADRVTVRLAKVAAVTAKATGPGEVTGPGLALTVTIENGTSQPVDLGSVVVNVTAEDETPGSQMTGKPARSFSGSLKAGAKATGVYVYAIPTTKRDPVTVEVTVSPADPVVVFRGPAAR